MTRQATASYDPLPEIEGRGEPPSARNPIALAGLPPAARALALLSLARSQDRLLVVVTRTDADLETLARDLTCLGAITGSLAPEAIALFPPLAADPFDGLSPHLATVCARLRGLHNIATGAARIALVSGRALLFPLPPADLLGSYFTTLREQQRFAPADDADWFRAAGYRRVDLVDEPGEYSRRGGILDLFAPIHEEPIRIELEGNSIVSLRHFSPADQRSTKRLSEVVLSPAQETILRIPDIARLKDSLPGSKDGRELAEQLDTRGSFEGIAACARLLYPGTQSLLEAMAAMAKSSNQPLLVVDEPEMTLEQVRQERAAFLRAGEGIDAPAEAQRLMESEESIAKSLEAAPVHVRQLDILDEAAGARAAVRFKATGMPSYRGRLESLMTDIAAWRRLEHTVWLAMKSEGRAHRMISLLRDAELEAAEWKPGSGPGLYVVSAPGADVAAAGISGGFALPEANLVLVAEQEIFGEEQRTRRKSHLPAFTSDFRDLQSGRSRRARRSRRGPVRRAHPRPRRRARGGRDGRLLPGARQALRPRRRGSISSRSTAARGAPRRSSTVSAAPAGPRQGRRVKKAMQEMTDELLNLYARAQDGEGPRLRPRHAVAERLRGRPSRGS